MRFDLVKSKRGFTLLETIVGIVILSISFSILTSLLYPAVEQSADQLHQIRAAELGQSMLNEISNHPFDENSDRAGGKFRCGEVGQDACSVVMGDEEGGNRLLFDDVDDYHNLNVENASALNPIINSQNQPLTEYLGYSLSVTVCNDSDYDGNCATNANNFTAKLILVTVTTPTGFAIDFSTYKANF